MRSFKRWIGFFAGSACVLLADPAGAQMLADITGDVVTRFATYQPISVSCTPCAPDFTPESDFGNVSNFGGLEDLFTETDLDLLRRNQFTIRYAPYKQIFDIYNECTLYGAPVFVTTDAVLHAYHVLFDQLLMHVEMETFVTALDSLTKSMISWTEEALNEAALDAAAEAAMSNLAFLHVADGLLERNPLPVPESVADTVNAELALIAEHDGFHWSPIFGRFSMLDYSQLTPRGHYTKNDTLRAYFRTMMWYGWTIFTMEPDLFGDLARRHTLQALMLTQAVFHTPLFCRWERIYTPTVFFVGRTDDPNIFHYREIGEAVYGPDFLDLPPDSLADPALLDAFMTEAQTLPEPKISNYIYGSTTTYKGFRFMGQRFTPDSYVFDNVVSQFRPFPKGLDIMAVLGSDRALTLLDSVYRDNLHLGVLADFRAEFAALPDSAWAQNLYWNWLYCLMPLLFEKGSGYPPFMQSPAWSDKELLAALSSWAELRHDTILYVKQSATPIGTTPPPPKSYVEPNPHLYARLAALVQYTKEGLLSRGLPVEPFTERMDLLRDLLCFLTNISVKELENRPISDREYDQIFGFGDALSRIIQSVPDPDRPWETEADDMAVVADVHTDHNSNRCLEEGVGYPLEIDVIVYEGGLARICRGAVFSYYEFTRPISDRLTDEAWRGLLAEHTEPDMPQWILALMDSEADKPGYQDFVTDALHGYQSVDPDGPSDLPDSPGLLPAYPNPFNPAVRIPLRIGKRTHTDLTVYDLRGRLVRTIWRGPLNSGSYEFLWNGRNEKGLQAASGVYLIVLKAGERLRTAKVVLMR